jgi:hypothetical protein
MCAIPHHGRLLWRIADGAEYCQLSESVSGERPRLILSHGQPDQPHLAQHFENHAPIVKDADSVIWGNRVKAEAGFRGDFDE